MSYHLIWEQVFRLSPIPVFGSAVAVGGSNEEAIVPALVVLADGVNYISLAIMNAARCRSLGFLVASSTTKRELLFQVRALRQKLSLIVQFAIGKSGEAYLAEIVIVAMVE